MGAHRDLTASALVGTIDGSGGLDAVLEDAVTEGGVVAYVQCIVDLARGSIVGYEALARFRRAGQDSPASVFAAARQRGRLSRLEAAALRATLSRLDNLPDGTFLTVNVTPETLDSAEVREVFDAQRSLERVVLELTEHVGVDRGPGVLAAIDRLRAAGARIAVDDGGSAYTRLHDLIALRPDFVKLDRATVSGVDRDDTRKLQIEMVGTLASRLDAQLLAEGVETLAELDTISRLGVHLAQGYLLARPSPSWPIVREQTTALLQTIAAQYGGASLVDLLQTVPSATSVGEAQLALGDRVDMVVLVDDHGRPNGIVESDGVPRMVLASTGTTYVRTPVAAGARFAVTRPEAYRYHPLVCTDEHGRYVGVVPVESLISHLALR